MKTALATKSPRPETPFGAKVPWAWNEVPTAGIPTRPRCQRIANDDERKAGAKLIAAYREQEAIAAENDIEGRTERLNQSYRIKTMSGVEQEQLRREITAADNGKFVAAETRLSELREETFLLAVPVFRRLIDSLDAELNENAIASEQRLDRAGIPVKDGAEWALHGDMLCCALWSQRRIVEKTFGALQEHRDGIGACQFLLTDEANVPFQWL
jgi:hypothetical protein